ncbi:isoprenylcysteine carboxyl methyltransferase family protein [Priestia aryabhattai]|uniref:isoprenylcysteine carboxyl methyltransferase family protein n=1 Tax=Priestia TaxID=2800373 RepID=UPI0015F70789|nr:MULTISPECIES: isoprenylcysteine carboxylmethyltransferase family protein [Priestia]MBY0073955.1 isoprenylcysteine carboxyl methyltransferase [Priestia aryabhattai]MDT0148049.1 isoprenylcysteine carboxylmethyltransferase family protein [Priestia aryabhattai]MDT0154085.1 isoprenylcysteine carboxylmethyltransferase family protein [Priestia aryabhattai]MEB4856336.1 isoprenylcysteine carboxylmethyltransferase family protein [Priestia megaterium]MED3885291.1 isoprenylcysteine carboxylmethyltransf
MFFYSFFVFIILQRLCELVIAKRNEAWMKKQGAYEAGQSHYKWMVSMHAAFFAALFTEVYVLSGGMYHFSFLLFSFFVLVQLARVWAISSLGKYWNTKIIVLPNAKVVLRGPYRFMKHPNYTVVAAELVLVPLMFQAYWTLAIFSVFNLCILAVRIPLEEQALTNETNYGEVMQNTGRFFPAKKSQN